MLEVPGGSFLWAALGGRTRSGIGDKSFFRAHVASSVLSDFVHVLVYQCRRLLSSAPFAWGTWRLAVVLPAQRLVSVNDRRCASQLSSWFHCAQVSLFDACSPCLRSWSPCWRRGTVSSSAKVTCCMSFLALGAERGRLPSLPSLWVCWNSADGITGSVGFCAIAEVACASCAIGTGSV